MTKCEYKSNRFYDDLACKHEEDPLVKNDVVAMWNYKNSQRGVLDMVPYNDQDDSMAAKWYEQDRSAMRDLSLEDPQLDSNAQKRLDNILRSLGLNETEKFDLSENAADKGKQLAVMIGSVFQNSLKAGKSTTEMKKFIKTRIKTGDVNSRAFKESFVNAFFDSLNNLDLSDVDVND